MHPDEYRVWYENDQRERNELDGGYRADLLDCQNFGGRQTKDFTTNGELERNETFELHKTCLAENKETS